VSPATQARASRSAWSLLVRVPAALLAVYLVGRGIAELFIIHYTDPASYARDWGGPSLAGVLAVHSGPGLAIIVAVAWRWLRRGRVSS
jgi:hypothetical protein